MEMSSDAPNLSIRRDDGSSVNIANFFLGGLSVTGAISATKGSAGVISTLLSGNAAQSPYISFGRAAEDVRIQIAAATNDLFTGTVAGDYATNSNASIWFGSGGTPILKIASSGNVGIGTTNPTVKFQNSGDSQLIASGGASIVGNLDKPNYAITDTGGTLKINWFGGIAFNTSGNAQRFFIGTAGQFGIGASPSYGTAGQVLTSGGPSAAPTWAAAGGGGAGAFVAFSTTGESVFAGQGF
jgi:hypothetical protein